MFFLPLQGYMLDRSYYAFIESAQRQLFLDSFKRFRLIMGLLKGKLRLQKSHLHAANALRNCHACEISITDRVPPALRARRSVMLCSSR